MGFSCESALRHMRSLSSSDVTGYDLHDDRGMDRVSAIDEAVQLFKAMSSPIRLQIINLLTHGDRSVNEITNALNASQSNVSQHLSHLEKIGVVSRQKIGVKVIYKLEDVLLSEICALVCARNVNL